MVRDLVEVSYKMEQDEMYARVRSQAVQKANERLAKIIVPAQRKEKRQNQQADFMKMMQDLQQGQVTQL